MVSVVLVVIFEQRTGEWKYSGRVSNQQCMEAYRFTTLQLTWLVENWQNTINFLYGPFLHATVEHAVKKDEQVLSILRGTGRVGIPREESLATVHSGVPSPAPLYSNIVHDRTTF